MVSTHLENIRQIGSFPQVGVKIKIFETTTYSIDRVSSRSEPPHRKIRSKSARARCCCSRSIGLAHQQKLKFPASTSTKVLWLTTFKGRQWQPAPGGKVFGAAMIKAILPAQDSVQTICVFSACICSWRTTTSDSKVFVGPVTIQTGHGFLQKSWELGGIQLYTKDTTNWNNLWIPFVSLPNITRHVPQLPQCRQANSPASPQWTGFVQALQLPPQTRGFTHILTYAR